MCIHVYNNIFISMYIYALLHLHASICIHVIDLYICKHVIDKSGPDIIIHMAAQPLVRKSYLNPLGTFKTNVLGTANILEATRYCSTIKVILVVTSDKCYENIETDYLYTETDPLGGYDPYSRSKACAEHIASAYYRSYFREKGMGLATARAGNVIGGGDWSDDRLISDAAKMFSQNKKRCFCKIQHLLIYSEVR